MLGQHDPENDLTALLPAAANGLPREHPRHGAERYRRAARASVNAFYSNSRPGRLIVRHPRRVPRATCTTHAEAFVARTDLTQCDPQAARGCVRDPTCSGK